ncbi:MAG: SGNH/GDSL hydrolase family protein [Planctomycetes bacterium]|nr:SGNH/GDSL hydrolase family protein [Planctomycetota bacterium]
MPSTTRKNTNHRLIGSILACVWIAGCNTAADPKRDTPARSAVKTVYIQKTTLLETPLIGTERAFAPTCVIELESVTNNPPPTAAVFHLQIAAGDITRLQARLTDAITGISSQLVRVEDVTSRIKPSDCNASQPTEAAIEILTKNQGAFWANAPDASASSHEITVAIPTSALSSSTSLELYAEETSTGDPLGGDRIELVRDFFYLAAVGDSIVWGNGLREKDKFTSRVSEAIERATGSKVIRTVYAISGATLAASHFDQPCTFRCSGEVPTAYRSVSLQIDTMVLPDEMDLLLLNGCINDVDLGRIFSTDITPQEITELTEQFCGDEMRATLTRLEEIAPDLPIVVTGYYSVVSENSDFSSVFDWALSQGFDLGEIAPLSEIVSTFAANSNTFTEASNSALTSAIESAALQSENRSIRFVEPGFKPENAAFAEDSWVWNLQLDREVARRLGIDTGLVPQDPQLEFRTKACFEDGSISDPLTCLFASVGHPNTKGAKAYADAIIEALTEMGIIPKQ